MQKIKYIIPIALFLLLLNAKAVLADAYLIHLYYNTSSKTLSFDKFAPESISLDKTLDLSIIDFTQESETSSGQYTLTLYDVTNNEIISTQFDKKDGAFQLTIPYFSIGASLKIFDKVSGKELLSADLTSLLTCNGNGICELEKKENGLNCLGDCANSDPLYSEETKNKLKENNGEIKDPVSGEILLYNSNFSSKEAVNAKDQGKISLWLLILAAVALAGSIGYLIYKKFINKK